MKVIHVLFILKSYLPYYKSCYLRKNSEIFLAIFQVDTVFFYWYINFFLQVLILVSFVAIACAQYPVSNERFVKLFLIHLYVDLYAYLYVDNVQYNYITN